MKKLALMFALCVGGPGLAAESIPWAADIPTSVAEKIREDCAAKATDNYPLRATCIRWAVETYKTLRANGWLTKEELEVK